jgi:urea carboxylase
VIALGVRDCSVQRRNQKVLEETPAPNLPEGMAEELCAAAIKLAKAVNYRSAGRWNSSSTATISVSISLK